MFDSACLQSCNLRTAAHQTSLSITNSWSFLKLTSIESVMTSSHLILCRPLLLLPPIPPRIILTPALSHMSKSKSEVAQSCPTLCDPMDCSPPGSSIHGILHKSTGVGCHFLLQGIFPTQGSNPGVPHCR